LFNAREWRKLSREHMYADDLKMFRKIDSKIDSAAGL
jgi:hypothetical protein